MGMQYKPGRYHCRITNQGFGKTQAGDDQFWLTFDVVGEINPADPDGDLLPAMAGERTAYCTLKSEKATRMPDDQLWDARSRSTELP